VIPTPATIALTGHRELGRLPLGAPALIRRQLEDLARSYPEAVWLSGGAIGTDQLGAELLLDMGQRVELVLPFAIEIQGARWTPAQCENLRALAARAASVEVLCPRYHVAGYHIRNRRLLDRADILVAVWNGSLTGGTASTVLQAKRRSIPVIRVGV
jgi:hypothetical protein